MKLNNLLRFWCFFKNKKPYVHLAEKHKTTARRVYQLAHGKKPETMEDYEILFDLKFWGILP